MPLAKTSSGNSSVFPELSTKSIEIHEKNGRFKARVHVIMKEYINKRGTWFTTTRRLSSLFFKVALTTELNSYDKYRDEPLFVNSDGLTTTNNKVKKEVMINVANHLSSQGLKNIKRDVEKFYYKNQDNMRVFQVPFFIDFELDTMPLDLDLFLIPKILSVDKQIPAYAEKAKNGYVKKDAVLRGGEAPASLSALLVNGYVWNGPVNDSSRSLTSRISTGGAANLGLSIQNIPNTKVKDYRVKDSIASIAFAGMIETPSRVKELENRDTGISDMFKTKNVYDIPTFAFSINFNTLLKRHLSFAIQVGSSKIDLGEFVRFNSMRILRKRVTIDGDRVIPTGEVPVAVGRISNLEAAVKGVSTVHDNVSIIRDVLPDQAGNSSITHFEFSDRTLEIADGAKYQYVVEMTVQDRSAERMAGVIREIRSSIRTLRRLYTASVRNFNADTQVYDYNFRERNRNSVALVDGIRAVALALTYTEVKPDYDRVVKFLMNIASVDTGSPDGVLTVISMLESLSNKIEKKSEKHRKKLTTTTGKAYNLSTRNFKGQTIRHYFNDYYDVSLNKYAYDFLGTINEENETPSSIDESVNYTPMRTLTVSQYRTRTDFEMNKYFKDIARQTRSFSGALVDINNTALNPADSITETQFSFLTPTGVKMSEVKTTQVRDIEGKIVNSKVERAPTQYFDNLLYDVSQIEHSKFNDLISKAIFINSLGKDSQEREKGRAQDTIGNNMDAVFSNLNVKATAILDDRENDRSKSFDASSRRSKTERSTSLVEEDLQREKVQKDNTYLLGIFGDMKMAADNSSIKMFDLKDRESPVNKDSFGGSRSKEEKINKIKSLPNQLKSLMMVQLDKDLVKTPSMGRSKDPMKDQNNFGFIYMYYKNIMVVEYLDGYVRSDSGQPNPKAPIWKKLTESKLQDSSIGTLLCRMQRYEEKDLGIKRSEFLELPVYDEYFKITTENSRGRSLARNTRNIRSEIGSIMSQVSETITRMRNAFALGTVDYISPEDASSTTLMEEEATIAAADIVESEILNLLG